MQPVEMISAPAYSADSDACASEVEQAAFDVRPVRPCRGQHALSVVLSAGSIASAWPAAAALAGDVGLQSFAVAAVASAVAVAASDAAELASAAGVAAWPVAAVAVAPSGDVAVLAAAVVAYAAAVAAVASFAAGVAAATSSCCSEHSYRTADWSLPERGQSGKSEGCA